MPFIRDYKGENHFAVQMGIFYEARRANSRTQFQVMNYLLNQIDWTVAVWEAMMLFIRVFFEARSANSKPQFF